MPGYTAVDLSRLPAPNVIEPLSYEQILAEMVADLKSRSSPDAGFTALVESDPLYKGLQVAAYRELLLRQRVNDAARAVMLAYAMDGDLDNLGALVGVTRMQLDPGDPDHSVPPTKESNTDFRRRITLAPEGYSVAGPEGAYIFHALSAAPGVLDASATSPEPDDIKALVYSVLTAHGASAELVSAMQVALDTAKWPGDVTVTVLSRDADGTPSQELLDAVAAAVSADDTRPMTDHVSVNAAEIIRYKVKAKIYTYAGPDASVVLDASRKRLAKYRDESHRLGRDVTLSGIYAALHSDGVQRVELIEPTGNIVVSRTQAAYCPDADVDISDGGVDE